MNTWETITRLYSQVINREGPRPFPPVQICAHMGRQGRGSCRRTFHRWQIFQIWKRTCKSRLAWRVGWWTSHLGAPTSKAPSPRWKIRLNSPILDLPFAQEKTHQVLNRPCAVLDLREPGLFHITILKSSNQSCPFEREAFDTNPSLKKTIFNLQSG